MADEIVESGASSRPVLVTKSADGRDPSVLEGQPGPSESAESLDKMAPLHRVVLTEMTPDLVERLTALVDWWGSSVAGMAPAGAVLEAARDEVFSDEDDRELHAFARGEQWPGEVKSYREEQERPCLVLNRIRELIAASLAAHRRAGLVELDEGQRRRLTLVITRENRDAQLLYNYLVSAVAEWTGLVNAGRR